MRDLLWIAAVITIVGSTVAAGEVADARIALSDIQVERIITHAQANFWGGAVGHDGKLLSPTDEDERQRLLIPRVDAERVVHDAHKYGLALWCNLDWKPTYLRYMQVERRKRWNEKQIAFIGVLFGVTQGAVKQWAAGTCTEEYMLEIQKAMSAELTRLAGDSESP